MSEAINPYIAGNPVTGTEMFFGRQDVFEFIAEALTGRHRDNVIVLYGQRRTGKTSVLYQMSRHLGERYACIFIDLHGLALEGLGGFLWELANSIARTLRREHKIDLPRLVRADFMTDPRSSFENDFLGQVWSAIGERHILLMLDEAIRLQEQVQAGKLEKEIFEYLRHLMQHHERLNFLFSLGSGLEEMEKEYAFLFSVGLYKKISFLEQEAAMALITQPVKDCYQIEPTAIKRILQVTSGHPYYTQLLCHSLFNRWQQQRKPQMDVDDVNAILDEVVERGLAVLKHVWEESSPGEKAVLAGIAASIGERNRSVGPHEISRAWARHNVALPEGETAKAIKSLIARDVITGQDRYRFTIDLQQLWVLKYERLEWVREEIANELAGWQAEYGVAAAPRSFWASRKVLAGTAVVFGLFLTLLILVWYLANLAHSAITEGRIAATKSAQQLQTAIAAVTASAREADATATVSAKTVQMAVANSTAAANAPAPTAAAAATQYVVAASTATRLAIELNATATANAQLIPPQSQIAQRTSTPTETSAPAVSPTPTPCLNASDFVADVTVQDGTRFDPGQAFTKTWRLKNSGTCVWGDGYELYFVEGDSMGGPTSIKLSVPVRSGEETDVSVQLKASQQPGTFKGRWQLRDGQGQAFGATPFVNVYVSPAAVSASDLISSARSATWSNGNGETGLWLEATPDASNPLAPRGFAVYVPKGSPLASGAEVKNDQQIIETHPQFVPNGEIRGSFQLTLPPQARFSATLEFLMGATQSDGVHVEVWWLDATRGTSPGEKVTEADVRYAPLPLTLDADMSKYGGQTGQLQLVVKAGATSGEDWITWRDVKVSPK